MPSRSARRRRAGAALLAALAFAPAVGVAAHRIVSLNLCTDQLLVQLAPQRIAALSPLARDATLSVMARAARQYPIVRADAEAVLRLRPDLVLAGTYGAQATLAVLRTQGIPVVQFDAPQDFPGIRAQYRRAGMLLGAPALAENLIAGMDRRLGSISPPSPHRPTAILWQAHGYSSGAGTLGHAVLVAAGFEDAGTGGIVEVETLAARPPDRLVVETAPPTPSLATDMLQHPAVAAIPRRTVPSAWLACGTPQTAEAAVLIAR